MRKFQQKLIFDLLQTIKQAQSGGQYADCQEGALSIGKFIENIEGEGTRTVALLEEYCELLFKVNNGEDSEELLQKCLNQLESSVRNELRPNKIEMAFLSYNASMSDSIESIYVAAKADPNCDAYWIPIPFFERKPDGSLGAMHYEGSDCYGGDIECTDWLEFDIEARHPDVIFTFAPYDAGNYVTSVHPDFYCERLRELTDLLVYVPYFIVSDDVEEHFCTIAGCMYAHKVIVQSEKIREKYIRVFKETFGSKFGISEDKFITLGSPKFDAIINAKREYYKLPDEWLRLIDNKKVVLYNTSVGAILQENEQYLNKLRHVLDVFRERDDIVVWWRPHPLIEETLTSMRPQLLDEYRSIVTEYKSGSKGNPVGILDNSADLHRSIAMSDAYFGDWSSLVTLYQKTGKPIMIQCIEEHKKESINPNNAFSVFDMYDDGDCYWFASASFNALFKMKKGSKDLEHIGSFPDEDIYGNRLYTSVVECNGKLFFTPCSAFEIGVYDIINAKFEKLNFGMTKSDNNLSNPVNVRKYIKCFVFDEKIFYIPCSRGELLIYDVKNRILSKENIFYDHFFKKRSNQAIESIAGFCLCWSAVRISDTEIAFPLHCISNIVVIYNLQIGNFTEYYVGDDKHSYNQIEYDGNYIWLYSIVDDTVVRWNYKTDETDDIVLSDKLEHFVSCGLNCSFSSFVLHNGFIYLIPAFTNIAIRIDTVNFAVNVLDELAGECNVQGYGVIYSGAIKSNNTDLFFIGNRSKKMIVFNDNYHTFRTIELNVDEELKYWLNVCNHIQLNKDNSESMIFDESWFKLEDLIDKIGDLSISMNNSESGAACGLNIFNYVKNIISEG